MSNLPLNINFTQIFLHLLNFLILFAILYFLLYKPVKNFMENREKTYRDMDDEARDNLRASEETKAQYEIRISEAESEISQMKQKSRQDIEKNRDSQLQAAKDEAERIIREAKEEATREKEKIISEAQAEISEMVTDATEKLALKATAGEAFDQFLDAVDLAEERGSKHEQ
ncbi:MAG: ATP synthase F0 subunit B [Firmicutes bacterium]|nr:ATP synthase F0 subunit B [Bacillota bacterium]